MEAQIKLLQDQVADPNRRLETAENAIKSILWTPNTAMSKHKETQLLEKYGEYVDKTRAAEILGVTRATIYAMLADGRIEGAHKGSKVNVRSIARYIVAPKSNKRARKINESNA